MNRIFKDSILDIQLSNEGYVVLPLLTNDEVKKLLDFYDEHHSFRVEAMYASAHSPDIVYRKKMSDYIHSRIAPHLGSLLEDVQLLGGSFITKGKDNKASLPPHQDWNIVDETIFRSFNLWVPLVNTSASNGGIMVLPRSHKFGHIFRGPNISSAYEHVVDILWNNMVPLDIPAGHALLYDHRLIHASGINYTNDLRIVVVMGILDKEAEMKIYYQNGSEVEEWCCDQNFFLERNPQNGPTGLKLNRRIKWESSVIDKLVLTSLFNEQDIKLLEFESNLMQEIPSDRVRLNWFTRILNALRN